MKTSNNIINFAAVLIFFLNPSAVFAQQGNPDTSGSGLYRLGVAYGSSLFSQKEEFQFKLSTGEKIVLNKANPIAYFSRKFKTGETYTLSQLSGPRTCNYWNQDTGTIANQDIVITANCGNPSFSIYKANFRGIETGETFKFADDYGRTMTIPFSATNQNLGGYPVGDTFTFKQTAGPRACIITPASFIVTATPITVDCDCNVQSTPPVVTTPASSTILRGELTAPAGTTILLQYNGAKDITLKTNNAGKVSFSFNNVTEGSTYNITVKSAPEGMKFIMEQASGTKNAGSFVKIRGDYECTIISRDSTATPIGTFFESWDPVIQKAPNEDFVNSRYIVFVSQAQGLCGSTGRYRQIFRKDMLTGKLIMLSRSLSGEEGNGNSFNPVISVMSNKVVYESYASNLVNNDANGVRDIFLWSESVNGINTERVSEGAGGKEANAQSFDASPSGDCNYIAFASSATNLLDDGTEVSGVNVYLWNRNNKKITLISKDPKTGKGVGGEKPSMDMNGYKIAFWSNAYTLDPNDKNNLWDIYLYERNTRSEDLPLRRITMAYDGGERNQGDESSSRVVTPVISGDGKFIAYATTASNVVPGDNNKAQDVFIYDVDANTTVRASVNNDGAEGNGDSPYGQGERIAITFNGSKVAFTTKASNFGTPAGNVVLYELNTKKMIPVTFNNGGYVSTPDISRLGLYVVFGCSFPLDGKFNSSGLFRKFMYDRK